MSKHIRKHPQVGSEDWAGVSDGVQRSREGAVAEKATKREVDAVFGAFAICADNLEGVVKENGKEFGVLSAHGELGVLSDGVVRLVDTPERGDLLLASGFAAGDEAEKSKVQRKARSTFVESWKEEHDGADPSGAEVLLNGEVVVLEVWDVVPFGGDETAIRLRVVGANRGPFIRGSFAVFVGTHRRDKAFVVLSTDERVRVGFMAGGCVEDWRELSEAAAARAAAIVAAAEEAEAAAAAAARVVGSKRKGGPSSSAGEPGGMGAASPEEGKCQSVLMSEYSGRRGYERDDDGGEKGEYRGDQFTSARTARGEDSNSGVSGGNDGGVGAVALPLAKSTEAMTEGFVDHMKWARDKDGVWRSTSNIKVVEERLKADNGLVQGCARLLPEERFNLYCSDLVMDLAGLFAAVTEPLGTGMLELTLMLEEHGADLGGMRDYSQVCRLIGCPILEWPMFERFMKGQFVLPIGQTKPDRTKWVNLDAFKTQSTGRVDPQALDVGARQALVTTLELLEVFMVLLFRETWVGCLEEVKGFLNGPEGRNFMVCAVTTVVETAISNFFRGVYQLTPLQGLRVVADVNGGHNKSGYSHLMAGRFKSYISSALKTMRGCAYPHSLLLLACPGVGYWGAASPSGGKTPGGGTVGSSAHEAGNEGPSPKKKKKPMAAPTSGAAATSTANTQAASSAGSKAKVRGESSDQRPEGDVVKSPAGNGGGPRGGRPCMRHLLSVVGLTAEPCSFGEKCKFAHWKKGRMSEEDLEGPNWVNILKSYPTLLQVVRDQHRVGSRG
jgi:hypothetical protein